MGLTFPLNSDLHPVETADGLFVLSAIIDITDTVRTDRQRRRLLQRLEKTVQSRDNFLAIASHELKTPLAALQLNVQAFLHAMKRCGPCDTHLHTLKPKLGIIEQQTARLSDLINHVLDVSRITAGRLTLSREEVDLHPYFAKLFLVSMLS